MGHTQPKLAAPLSRRQLLRSSGLGLGSLALSLAARRAKRSRGELSRRRSTCGPSRRRRRPGPSAVIMLMQNGGPSQMDLFDPKPELTEAQRPEHSIKVEMFQKGSEQNKLLASRSVPPHGASAAWSCRRSCRTSARSPTTCAWSARCTPSTTTTPKAW